MEWENTILGEIAKIQTGPFGSQLHQSDYVSEGIPCIMPTNIGQSLNINIENIAHIKESDAIRLSRHLTQEGDIIYSRRGDIEKCAYITKNEKGWLCGTGCLRVICSKEIVNPHFIAYYLSTQESKKWIVGNAVGTTMLNLNGGILSSFPIKLPNRSTQNNIVAILSSLDAKIENNNKINANLEAQAAALFKSWFVDFEPFRDGEFVESELGMIPKGWKVGKAEDFYSINIGKTPPRKEHEWFSDSPLNNKWVSISDMGSCGMFINQSSESLTNEAINRFNIILVPKNTILLSFKLTIGRVAIADCELTTNEAIARFILPEDNWLEYTYLLLKSYNYSCLGSTSSIATAVNSKIIKGMIIYVPSEVIIDAFHKIANPLFEIIRDKQRENQRLSSLRDTLLPKLMSGEIDLDNISI